MGDVCLSDQPAGLIDLTAGSETGNGGGQSFLGFCCTNDECICNVL